MNGQNFFETRAGKVFENRLLNSLEKIGQQLERANELKEKELKFYESEKANEQEK